MNARGGLRVNKEKGHGAPTTALDEHLPAHLETRPTNRLYRDRGLLNLKLTRKDREYLLGKLWGCLRLLR